MASLIRAPRSSDAVNARSLNRSDRQKSPLFIHWLRPLPLPASSDDDANNSPNAVATRGLIMESNQPRKRGRPKGTTKAPHDQLLHVWIRVESVRKAEAACTGIEPSTAKVCRIIEQYGGMHWIVGGDREAIARYMAGSPRLGWRRCRVRKGEHGSRLTNDKDGPVFVSNSIAGARTLRARYVEANRLVRDNPDVRRAWTRMLGDRRDT